MLIGLFGFANHRNAKRKIETYEVSFDKGGDGIFITKNEVDVLLKNSLGNIQNKAIEDVKLKHLEDRIEANPMVEKAEVSLTIDGVLKTEIVEKKPIARIVANATSYYLDRQGRRMQLSKNHSARVPIVTGIYGNDDLTKVYQFINDVLKDDFMKKQVIGISLLKNDFFNLKTRMGNQIIEFGRLDNIDNKIRKLKAFYQKMEKDKSLDKYRILNLEYRKQVVCVK